MIAIIRVKDIPVLLISIAIDLSLIPLFFKLVERGTININRVSNGLFGVVFFGILGLSLWASTFIWKWIRGLLQRNRP